MIDFMLPSPMRIGDFSDIWQRDKHRLHSPSGTANQQWGRLSINSISFAIFHSILYIVLIIYYIIYQRNKHK